MEESLTSREAILGSIRAALKRSRGASVPPPPPVLLDSAPAGNSLRIEHFCGALQKLAGKTFIAETPDEARLYVAALLEGQPAIASNASLLKQCGLHTVPGVVTDIYDKAYLRELCANSAAGITGADYALADTGSLVLLAGPEEARMISLLPPLHIALVARERILASLDELLHILPQPVRQTSSMVIITGPSRTGDIEQILVRGVHGPGEIHAIIV